MRCPQIQQAHPNTAQALEYTYSTRSKLRAASTYLHRDETHSFWARYQASSWNAFGPAGGKALRSGPSRSIGCLLASYALVSTPFCVPSSVLQRAQAFFLKLVLCRKVLVPFLLLQFVPLEICMPLALLLELALALLLELC